MNTASLARDALIPRNPDGIGRGLGLALLVHALLVVAIAFGVSWRSSSPAGVEAELWASVPQIAAPRPVEPEPTPPPPKKLEPAPPKPEPVQKVPDAQIAIEKAKKEEQKRLEDAKREELQRQKEEQDRKKKEAADKLRKEQAEAATSEKRHQEQIARMAALAGATGEPSATGNALRTAGPSATYAGRIKARILPNIVLTDSVDGNPLATVEVRAGPDGTIIGRRLIRSSGVKAWDEAVLRAIDKTEVLPRDTDGRVPSSFEISFRPRE